MDVCERERERGKERGKKTERDAEVLNIIMLSCCLL